MSVKAGVEASTAGDGEPTDGLSVVMPTHSSKLGQTGERRLFEPCSIKPRIGLVTFAA
jgi:hypothetical protein